MERFSQEVWEKKYLWDQEKSLDDSIKRVAKAVASVEESSIQESYWENQFYYLMQDAKFLPGGRILASAGTTRRQTLFNCFTLPKIEDSIEGIFEAIKLNAIVHSTGGGTGANFSSIRPKGDPVQTKGGIASGPVSFMTVFDAETKTITTGNARKGANMGILNIDHPDIEEFITAKQTPGVLTQFNLSVAITDEFLDAVENNQDWVLKFNEKSYKTLKAKYLWDLIIKSAYEFGEPGVLNLSTINRLNNLYYLEYIDATNPCSEQPLPPNGCCLLGSFNLVKFIKDPFTENARFDFDLFKSLIPIALRLLDNVIEISIYPTKDYEVEEKSKRRIGIGVMGLGSALAMLGLKYSSQEGRNMAGLIMQTLRDTLYLSSALLAKERGPFLNFVKEKYLNGEYIKRLPSEVRDVIKEYGIHNSHLTSVAPTGTLAIVADNVSSGIEPIFSLVYKRRVKKSVDSFGREEYEEYEVTDYAYRLYLEKFGTKIPSYFETAYDISPEDHLEMLKVISYYVDSSVSKTINVSQDYPLEKFDKLYMSALRSGIKGFTVYREGSREGILIKDTKPKQPSRPQKLEGVTYKLKTPRSSYYITINHRLEGNKKRPYEIFINTKDATSAPWITALSRLISAIFMREERPEFIIDQLKTIVDANGGYWREGRRIPSVLADIAGVLEQYFSELGLVDEKQPEPKECPECGALAYVLQEGCGHCLACGYSGCS